MVLRGVQVFKSISNFNIIYSSLKKLNNFFNTLLYILRNYNDDTGGVKSHKKLRVSNIINILFHQTFNGFLHSYFKRLKYLIFNG